MHRVLPHRHQRLRAPVEPAEIARGALVLFCAGALIAAGPLLPVIG
ncbi:hypothetical protein [Qipengyuania thermophila]|nr:hypothetical protein [Qipengyuania thermophila]